MISRETRHLVRKKFTQRGASVVAGLLLFAIAAFGQGNRGSLTGTITDPQGGVTPNATVDVKNMDTGELFHGGASSTGNYVVPVPVGKYELSVTAAGFKKYVRANLEVVGATDTRVDVRLELGATTDTITITDEAPLLKTESGEISHTITTDEVSQLPVLTTNGGGGAFGNIRDPLQEIVLLPGTAYQNGLAVVVNGLPANSENIRIEGQDSTSNIWKIAQQNSQGSVEAIQEVAIQTSNFAAEYGQAAGGYFNYTMKSGTNQFHGSGYDFFVNEALYAGTPFTDRCTQDGRFCTDTADRQHIRNRIRRNDYGFTFGGPVRIPKLYDGRNKTFFFVNFEQFRQDNVTGNSTASVPTPAYQQGNFATALCSSYNNGVCTPFAAITNRATGVALPAQDPSGQSIVQGMIFNPYSNYQFGGQTLRVPFANNTIPLSLQDSVAQAIQKLLPQPNANLTSDLNNYSIPGYASFQHTTNFSVKLDQSISSTMKISGYYSQLETFSPNVNGGITPLALGGTDTNQWNHTIRANFDQTITPTLLFHVGIGYFETSEPHVPPPFDQSTIGLKGYQANQIMPDIGGISGQQGGYSPGFGAIGATFSATAYEEKPTANTSLTWIRGNHTYKAGADYTQEGYPVPSQWRANGNFAFSANETADPWTNTVTTLNITNPTGFGYASFLTGLPTTLNLNAPTDSKLGYHSIGLFVQDSWKVTRKLTLDLGLRYDYQTYMTEEYGRMQDASFSKQDTLLNRPGALVYGANCNCQFSHNYPYAFGPRVGAAYQIDSKTVLRGGAGIQYDVAEAPNGVLYSAADYYIFPESAYGQSPMQFVPGYDPTKNGLQAGNPYAAGNTVGNNTPIVWPNLDPNKYPFPSAGLRSPQAPAIFLDPNNRPGRIFTWSIGVQREVMKNLVVEVSYVGNRGAYFPAPNMDQIASNSLTPAQLKSQFGIDFTNANDRALLTDTITNPAVQARFPGLVTYLNGQPIPAAQCNSSCTVPSVYAGFPAGQQLIQALRGIPQWGGVTPWVGPPMGKTWYDSMQVKVTKRYSHGLQAQGNFTWAKGDVIGSASDSTLFLTGQAITTDIYNFDNNKQLNQYVRPLAMTITFSYTTPKMAATGFGMKMLSQAARDWQLGAVLRYQSGQLIGDPSSVNGITSQLARGASAFGAGASNFQNLTGQPLFLISDPNCGCFNPQTTQVLNPAAFTDAPAGTWGTSAPFYNNYRWQRQPAESMSFARNFRVGKEGKYNLQIRGEFFNVFNRMVLPMPAITNPAATIGTLVSSGVTINNTGYGVIATNNGIGTNPRSGQLVARFQF
jgi:Carboxypeptidase regulatory-like domain/TonB dependent receptor-like, beta-barrel